MRGKRRNNPARLLVLLLLLLVLAGILLLRVFLPGTQPADAAQPEESIQPKLLPEESPAPAAAAAPTEPPAATPAAASPVSEPLESPFVEPRGYTQRSYQLVTDLVCTYAEKQQEGAAETEALLTRLREEDPDLGALWTEILRTWDFVNTELETPSELPDGLPMDDSLCIVVLGFQLLPDGGMSEELIRRCETALACAEKYPEALLAVTGGGTARQNRAVTEAGAMADWLKNHGVSEERLLVEDRSLTTADNAVFTAAILRERAPQVRTLAVVSSDYHLPLGWLLFEEEALILGYQTGDKPYSVAACAAYDAPDRLVPDTPMRQKSYVWSVADPKY